MYKFKAQKHQQSTSLTAVKDHSSVIIKAARIQSIHQSLVQNKLNMEFSIHENHEHSSEWNALEYNLKTVFEQIAAVQLLPALFLKIHIFVLEQDKSIQSVIFNAVWVCLMLHGVPLKRSVFHYQWQEQNKTGKVLLDLHNPTLIVCGQYNSAPPQEAEEASYKFKEIVVDFMQRQWAG